MSFSVSISHFVDTAKLARHLYRDIYQVARHAPREIQKLGEDLAVLAQSVDFLVEQCGDPDSTLSRAGEDRVETANRIMEMTRTTLTELEEMMKKHQIGSTPSSTGRAKKATSVIWSRVKYALDAPAVGRLGNRIQHHNSQLNLILTSAGNSSLERLEKMNSSMQTEIDQIRALLVASSIHDSHEAPLLSSVNDDRDLQIFLTESFLRASEKTRPWTVIGFDEWVQAGRRWLGLSRFQLLGGIDSDDAATKAQGYVNLLKAAWILVDILPKHPHLRHWTMSPMHTVFLSLSRDVRRQLASSTFPVVTRETISRVNLQIWSDNPSRDYLIPNPGLLDADGRTTWKLRGGFVLFSM